MAESSEGSYHYCSQSGESYHEKLKQEPVYEAFVCPLTKQIMQNPVTIETGRTFEREAIEKWFEGCRDSGRMPICPLTNKELKSFDLTPSIALRKAIQEWRKRNETAQLVWASRTLTQVSTESDILHALECTIDLCQNNGSNKHAVRKEELIPQISEMLKNSNRNVRCKALATLCVVAEDDDDNKEAIAVGDTIRTIVKFLTQEHSQERERAVSLLCELSKSHSLCEKIGDVNGAILILVGMPSSESEGSLSAEKAEKTLENLEKCEKNVKQMAEIGRLQPLLARLLQGSIETQVSMATYLGELVLTNDVKVFVAQTAGPTLVNIMTSRDMRAREAALKALNKISSHETSAKILAEADILPPLVKDLFAVGINQLPMKLKEVSATVLTNIVASGFDITSIALENEDQTLIMSEDIIHNLLHLISNTGPAIECKLLQVLVGLTSFPTTVEKIVSAIKNSGATISLIQFIEASQRDLRMASIKLLHNISPYMGEELAEIFRNTTGHLGSLIKIISDDGGILEEQSAAANLLANLSERELGLIRLLLHQKAFDMFITKLVQIRQGSTRGNRFVTPFLEGLVKVLSKLTYALQDEPEALAVAREHNLGALFTSLLQMNGLDKIQIVAALSLENLSKQSKHLTRVPTIRKSGLFKTVFSCFAKQATVREICGVHHGICSMRESFCLLEGKAVEKLVACLDHQNEKLVEAAMAAVRTLLEDGVDIEKGVQVLCDEDSIKPILQILLESRTEILREQAVWSVERFLRTDDIAYDISVEQNVVTALVEAFQHGCFNTRMIAEQALRHVDRLPKFSGIFQNQANV